MNNKTVISPFFILATSQFISQFGNNLLKYSLALYILETTGSVAMFSILTAVTMLPQIFVSPYGGALADFADKKWIMVILDAISAVMLIAYYIIMRGNDSVLAMGIFICVMSIFQNIYDPVVRATIPNVVSGDKLTRANSIIQIITTVAMLMGPVAAGFIYGAYGIYIVLLIDGISFVVSAIISAFLKVDHEKKQWKGNPLIIFTKDLIETYKIVKSEKKILLYMAYISAGMNFLVMPLYLVGVPFLQKQVFNATNEMYGISEACIGAGVIVGAIIAGIIGKKTSIKMLSYVLIFVAVFILAMGGSTLAVDVQTEGISYLAYILLTVAGFCFIASITVSSVLCASLIQRIAPKNHLGKTIALVNALSTAFLPIGQVAIGGLYEVIDTWYIILYMIISACMLAIAVAISKLIKMEALDIAVQREL